MDKNTLTELFDNAVKSGDQDSAIIYGTDLADMGATVHVMLGFKELQKQNPGKNHRSALLYAHYTYTLSKTCRRNADLINSMWRMNLSETVDAANVVDLYDNSKFDEYWDYLVHEYLCWNIVAAENSVGSEREEYLTELKNVMDTTKIRHGGSWINEYMEFLYSHPIWR